jgi:hypothetical protein
MIILTAIRFVRELTAEALALREQVMARYPHLRDEI